MNSARCSLGCYNQRAGLLLHQGIKADLAQPPGIIAGVRGLWAGRFLNIECGAGGEKSPSSPVVCLFAR
jgi:hypothetical protein